MTTTAERPLPVAARPAPPAGKRLASSIRLPWLIGLASLLGLAIIGAALAGLGRDAAGVSRAVLEAQQAAAVGSAEQIRRSLNEGSDDLRQVARSLDDPVSTDLAASVLAATAATHHRYSALALVRASDGRPVVRAPGVSAPESLGRVDDRQRRVRVLDDGRLLETVPVRSGRGLVVAAVYDPAYLVPELVPSPGRFYVVDKRGRAVAAPFASGLTEPLPSEVLRLAAGSARQGAGFRAGRTLGRSSVVGYAPVTGVGPAGVADLTVLIAAADAPVQANLVRFRREGLLAAGLLAGIVLLLFWWLHRSVVRPLLDLLDEAERIAYGDLSGPVTVDRYDEVGQLARALERLRLRLIRARVQDVSGGTS